MSQSIRFQQQPRETPVYPVRPSVPGALLPFILFLTSNVLHSSVNPILLLLLFWFFFSPPPVGHSLRPGKMETLIFGSLQSVQSVVSVESSASSQHNEQQIVISTVVRMTCNNYPNTTTVTTTATITNTAAIFITITRAVFRGFYSLQLSRLQNHPCPLKILLKPSY